MRRSVGVTISAVVVIIGSIFTLLGGLLMSVSSSLVPTASPAVNVPVNLGAILVVDAAMIFAFGGWGLASGIGLIFLKQWARISTLIFAGLLIFISLLTAIFVAVLPLPSTNEPNLPVDFSSIMRVGMALFYGMFAALGGFWLYFFNKRSVKAQFQPRPPVPESAAGDLFLAAAAPAPPVSQPARPLSITIIGWFLLVGSAFAPLSLLFNSALFPGMQFPFYFLGFFFFGRGAYVVLIVWMAAQMVAAVGLLKLKNWGRLATIGLQCLAIANVTLLVGIPGHRARFQQLMESMMTSLNTRMPQPAPFVFPVWAGLAMSLPIVLVILYFLITRRQAFTSGARELARENL